VRCRRLEKQTPGKPEEQAILSARVSSKDFSGLRAIKDLAGLRRRILIYNGHREMKTEDGIEIWPAGFFARMLAADRLWP